MSIEMIDWKRLAKPQKDFYDTEFFLLLAKEKNHSPDGLKVDQFSTVCDGTITVGYFEQNIMTPPRYKKPNDFTNLNEGIKYLESWDEVYGQFKKITKCIHPLVDTEIQEEYLDLAIGSSSFSQSLPFGYICATVDNSIGFAQALVHEMAHHKLRTIGIYETNADGVILNPKERKFRSPINMYYQDLITNIFHDLYTYNHIVNLDIKLIAKENSPDTKDTLLQLLAKNFIKLEFAFNEIKDEIIFDKDLIPFWHGVSEWVEDTINLSKSILANSVYKNYSK